ncbi:MAG: hypothetical protein GY832_16740 [Chloroflexi bacterium]|nr:hypothetical protein [Chloroflexota bacterium]
MTKLTRRQFITGLGTATAASFIDVHLSDDPAPPPVYAQPAQQHHIYVAKNGTPVTNVEQVIKLAGGIESFIGYDDVVVLKPNGQWPNQGYTHTECMKALIDVILARPGGFGGEIIIAEHIHRDSGSAMSGSYCWNMATYNRQNNWSDMNYLELEADYHSRGITNVTAIPLYDVGQSSNWEIVDGPSSLSPGMHGWVRTTYRTVNTNDRTVKLSHAILRSAYSDKLIDLGRDSGVWENGGYNGQQVRLIFLPTLNNHGSGGNEDYAGPTSAVKCHLGIVEFAGSGGDNLHSIGYGRSRPDAVGESVGYLITEIISPTFYLTCAEYTGHLSRTSSTAAQTKTAGLCADPVTLDYWMCKYVAHPIDDQPVFNPDNDNNLRQTLLGCNSVGVGTLNEAEMDIQIIDLSQQTTVELRGRPGDGTINLTWEVDGALPDGLTWEIGYVTDTGTTLMPAATGLPAATREHTLDNLVNGVWYTVTINAREGSTVILTTTVRVMPADEFVFLPLVSKGQ